MTWLSVANIDIWVCEDAKKWIKQQIKPCFDGFEWGSGCSTVWFGLHCHSLVSVENRLDWFNRVRKLLDENKVENVVLHHEPHLDNYISRIDDYPNDFFHFIFIDGYKKSRILCVQRGWRKLKPGGMLIFDNSEAQAYREAVRILDMRSDDKLDFSGVVQNPWNLNMGRCQTSVWFKND